jgi:hypothetical protein
MRTGQAAADYARSRVGGSMAAAGYCLQMTRENYPVDPYYYSAVDAGQGADYPHPAGTPDGDSPPVGVPVYFLSSSPYRHVAIYVGNGEVVTTWDASIRLVRFADMPATFGPYKGWTEDLNTERVWTPAQTVTTGDDDMKMIRSGSSGTISLIGDGWYLNLSDSSVQAFQHAGYAPPIKLATADYNTVIACLEQSGAESVLGAIARAVQ